MSIIKKISYLITKKPIYEVEYLGGCGGPAGCYNECHDAYSSSAESGNLKEDPGPKPPIE